jgi:hypothetical protein
MARKTNSFARWGEDRRTSTCEHDSGLTVFQLCRQNERTAQNTLLRPRPERPRRRRAAEQRDEPGREAEEDWGR